MNTDSIIKRLTDIASLRGPMAGSVIPDACMDAVLEIKRLQGEVKKWRNIADVFADAGTHPTAHDMAMDDYEEALSNG
jgi:hypothetical protein